MSLADAKTVPDYGEVDANDLVRLASNGCEDAFSELSLRFRPRLIHVLARRMGGRFADAEDITQEALAKAFSNLNRFDFQYRFSTWLYTIAFRVAQDHARKNRRWFSFVSFATLDDPASNENHATDMEAAEHVSNLWSRAKSLLSEDQYTAVWLRYAENLPVDDIAAIMRKSKVGVRVLLHRARLIMFENLNAGGDFHWPRLADQSRSSKS